VATLVVGPTALECRLLRREKVLAAHGDVVALLLLTSDDPEALAGQLRALAVG